ncbi:MAG: DUF5666 domain-containing protein [Pseudomonadota bacterium]
MRMNNWTRRRAVLAGIMAGMAPAAFGQSAPREAEGGIGGTGIVGLLTDFGSLIVAGVQVAQDDSTEYTNAFGRFSADALRRGDSLTIEARQTAAGLLASRVHVTNPLVGMVESVVAAENRLRINGVSVVAENGSAGLAVGDRVTVSGVWRAGRVIASRFSAAQDVDDMIAGDVTRGFGAVRIGGVDVRASGTLQLQSGSYAEARGQYDMDRGRFQASDLSAGRFTGAAGPLEALHVEGFLDPINMAPGFRVAGLGHSFARGLVLAPYAEGRTLFEGPYTGRFAAAKATRLPADSGARRVLLRRLSQNRG